MKKKKIDYLIIYWTIFIRYFFNNFSTLLLCKMNFLSIFNIVDFFQIKNWKARKKTDNPNLQIWTETHKVEISLKLNIRFEPSQKSP